MNTDRQTHNFLLTVHCNRDVQRGNKFTVSVRNLLINKAIQTLLFEAYIVVFDHAITENGL